MTRLAIALAVLLLPLTAGAHPDHGAGAGIDLTHLLTDPFHVLVIVAAAAGVGTLLAWRRSAHVRGSRR